MDFRAELYARGGYRLDESLVGFFVVVVVVFRSADSRRTEKTPATCTATKPATNTVTTTMMMIETTTEQRELLHVRACLVARVMCDDTSRALFFSKFSTFSNNEPITQNAIYILDTKKNRYARAFLTYLHFEKKKKKRKMMHRKNSKRSERADVCVLSYYVCVGEAGRKGISFS